MYDDSDSDSGYYRSDRGNRRYENSDSDNESLDDQCDIEFDGASRGNPGKSGAGAVVRNHHSGSTWRLREGLGVTTNNVAEYRGLILGMRFAMRKGFRYVRAFGDSLLVCNQVVGKWHARNPRLIALKEEVQSLMDEFADFNIRYIRRGDNADADYEATEASYLREGGTEEL